MFPPVDELFRWKDIWFEGTPFAINKTVILVILSSIFVCVFMFLGQPEDEAAADRGCRTSSR